MAKDLSPDEWEEFKSKHFGISTNWFIVPQRNDAYSPMFQGTLEEAMGAAVQHAAFWRTNVTLYHSSSGRRNDLDLVAKITIPEGSVIRYW